MGVNNIRREQVMNEGQQLRLTRPASNILTHEDMNQGYIVSLGSKGLFSVTWATVETLRRRRDTRIDDCFLGLN